MSKPWTLSANDLYTYYRPTQCELRVYLRHRGDPEARPDPYEEVLKRLGDRLEKEHLEEFDSPLDLSLGTPSEREARSKQAVAERVPVIYHPRLRVETILVGESYAVVGEPDFLILNNENYVIRDSKIARRINEKDHPEIISQLRLYGWLYEQEFGLPPSLLQVHSGSGELIEINHDQSGMPDRLLIEIAELKMSKSEPYSPVGWTKCGGCGFRERCWKDAEARRQVALVDGVDQGLARALSDSGIHTIDDLLAQFDEKRLSALERPYGKGKQKVGKRAAGILRAARAMASGTEIVGNLEKLPDGPNYVMFDLEGLPAQLDEQQKVYLWGLQVFGKEPGEFSPAVAGFGPEGDREGWNAFLRQAKAIFHRYGDLPFVHWHHYETTLMKLYLQRYGDVESVAERVMRNTLDLLKIVNRSITLPLPSYSLKVIEKYIGFHRSQDEYGGNWAMARYIEATETEDEQLRAEVMDQILLYNEEDLKATWEVLQWYKGKME